MKNETKKFKIVIPDKKKDTIIQTIRFSGMDYDIIQDLSIKYGISFNYIVNEMIKYAIKNMED